MTNTKLQISIVIDGEYQEVFNDTIKTKGRMATKKIKGKLKPEDIKKIRKKVREYV